MSVKNGTEKTESGSKNNETTFEYSIEGIIPGVPKSQADKDIFKIFGEAFSNFEEKIKCERLSINELTERKDLYIDVKSPVKIKPTGLSFSYYQYNVETSPIGWISIRKLSDFELLNETIPKFNKAKFNPVLSNFPLNLSDDSDKKLLFLKFYLNSLVEDSYYRSLPIVKEFLSLPQNEWDKKAKAYQKMKEIENIENMPNLQGYYDIKISNEDDFKAMKIKDEIKKKDEIYKKLNDNMDELFPIMEKMSVCLKNTSQHLLTLKNMYGDGNKCTEALSNSFQQLNLIIKTWGEDYIKQKNFLKNEFKYFFKFIDKELNSFMKNFETYEDIKDDFKKIFSKFQNMQSPSSKDQEKVNQYKNKFGFHLVHILDEYTKLNERQGKRMNKQFFLFNKQKELLFQDYDNFYRLFNFKENYSLPDLSMSYNGKPSDILNLNISKISKSKKNANKEREEKIVEDDYNDKDIEKKEEKEEKIEIIKSDEFNDKEKEEKSEELEENQVKKENDESNENEENNNSDSN